MLSATPPNDLDDVDRAALKRALEIAGRDLVWREHFRARLAAGEPWVEVAQAASFHCQTSALGLPPWRLPPCTGGAGDRAAAELCDRLLELGFSQWEPSPVDAIKRLKKRRRK